MQFEPAMSSPAVASTKVELFFRCRKLKDTDTFSKSDPYCVLFKLNSAGASHPRDMREVGRTEIIKDNLNPIFKRTMVVDYYFEQHQHFKVFVYDDDGKGMAGDDPLGNATFELGQVIGQRGFTLELPLYEKGKLYVTAVQQTEVSRNDIELAFYCLKIPKMDLFGSADPYFKLSRVLPGGATVALYKSETVKGTRQPKWRPLPKMRLGDMFNGNLHEKCLKFDFYDWDMIGSDDFIGTVLLSIQDLLDLCAKKAPVQLTKPKKTKTYGELYVASANVIQNPAFLDYLRGGFEINLAVSIDFTGSNGDPKDPKSLHYVGGGVSSPNQYERAIHSVGSVLAMYDADQRFPVLGFGAIMPNTSHVSHFFNVTLGPDPFVHGLDGVLGCYKAALPLLRLYGPTNFAPTIASVTRIARSEGAGHYTVLLILTDGEITDMSNTIDAIVAADDAPLSIVIVGVGNNSTFEAMDQLDSDNAMLVASNGRRSRRDLVQFVPFRDFLNKSQDALAAAVLEEVPAQFELWAKIAKVPPPPPQEGQFGSSTSFTM